MDKSYLENMQKENSERLHYWNLVEAKYGFSIVQADRAYAVFDETAKPANLGFKVVSRGLYAKKINDDITHLLRLSPLKGRAYTLLWSASLSFVPHGWRNELKWHRTIKASHPDIFCFGHESSFFGVYWREYEDCIVHTMNGEKFLKHTASLMWQKLNRPVTTWFSNAKTIDEIMNIADQQVRNKLDYHFPNPQMIYAFALARKGKLDDARQAIEESGFFKNETMSAQNNLRIALQKVAAAQ
jgi:hypothetical protein